MMWRTLLLVLCGVGPLSSAVAAPPRPGELEAYRKDGTLEERRAFQAALKQDEIPSDLIGRARIRLERATLSEQGLSPSAVDAARPLPPAAWKGMPTTGTNNVLVMLVEFPDQPRAPVNTQAYVDGAVFGAGSAGEEPYESLTRYYTRASFGQLTIQGSTLGWYRTAYNRSTIATTTVGRENLIKEMFQFYDTAGHDFTKYDNDGDGDIDYFIIIYAGPDTGWSSFWWAYQTGFADRNFRIDGKGLGTYVFQFQGYDHTDPFSPTVVIHETGHALGLPDYYDYDGSIGPDGGVGGLDMMDGNRGDHNGFSKWVLGWSQPTVIARGARNVALRPASSSGDGVILMPGATNNPFNEYFFIENRRKTSNDSGADWPGTGLLIWHVDATLNSRETDYIADNSFTPHKLLRLMEADGLEEIEQNGRGDAGDFYQPGQEFASQTLPSSAGYDGSPTYAYVRNIRSSGEDIIATIGFEGATIDPGYSIGYAEAALYYAYYSYLYSYFMLNMEPSAYSTYGYACSAGAYQYAYYGLGYLVNYGRTNDYFSNYRYAQAAYSYYAMAYSYYAFAETEGAHAYWSSVLSYYGYVYGYYDLGIPK